MRRLQMDMLVCRLVCPNGFVTYIGGIGDHFRFNTDQFRFGSNLRRGVVSRGGETGGAADRGRRDSRYYLSRGARIVGSVTCYWRRMARLGEVQV